tara:strand:+ start:1251 stop:1610 length:360 start_codon:yes stop_codon:yes gene_type:complete
MVKDAISHKDLSKKQLENLKDIYIDSRLSSMTADELSKFVRTILIDQIKGTVGNEEEREAWKEIKEFFGEDFEDKLKKVIKNKENEDEDISPEQEELEKRLKLLEQRKTESQKGSQDMW